MPEFVVEITPEEPSFNSPNLGSGPPLSGLERPVEGTSDVVM